MTSSPRLIKSKIVTPSTLKRIVARTRGAVVFTNGCFDLLHRGHVNYLERARQLGHLLIVALNSDSSVKKLKGPTRPLNPLADRLEVMAALESVDYVTWFEEETPLKLIQLIKPTVLVKGGDWKTSQIIGAKETQDRGGTVHSLPYLAGRSTTNTIKKAQAAKIPLAKVSKPVSRLRASQQAIKNRKR